MSKRRAESGRLPRLGAVAAAIYGLICCATAPANAQPTQRPYRLSGVDLKQRVIWGAECRQPDANGQASNGLAIGGLAFGGQDQDADDGRPHTRVLDGGQWKPIHIELRDKNPLQQFYELVWSRRQEAKNILARARRVYFLGLPASEEVALLASEVAPRLSQLGKDLAGLEAELPANQGDEYAQGQARLARQYVQRARRQLPAFQDGVSAGGLQRLHHAQIQLELAAEMLDAEPPPRAMDCGTARLADGATGPTAATLIYDPRTKRYLIFGGDHLDYLTNDTWVFDPEPRRWLQVHPPGAPPPRANHRLEVADDGKIRMTGGYAYSSNTDYVGGQYVDLEDGPWIYDIEENTWSGGELVAPDSRVYRTGPFHPDFYLAGSKPNAAAFEAWLGELPVNEWVPTNPPRLPRLNRDWGTARLDPDRDMMLRWSGGHSAHGGTDVPHFHFSTNRWELPFPVEFPLGQLYSNTSYPNGYNFNLRPWMTGHTYQNYDYDPPSKKMIKAGRPRHYYIYNPDVGDWIGRGDKPAAMQYNSCFYTLTLTATPRGVVCWDKDGRLHRYDHGVGKWIELELRGDKLPGAYVDNSTIAYDTQRDRVLMINTLGYGKPFDGQVWALDLKSNTVQGLSPQGRQHADRFANVDKCCYDAAHDLLVIGTFLKDGGDHTPTPAYDCAGNRWITLDIKYETGQRSNVTTRAFPHRRSDGLMFDHRRKLIWGTDTNSQVHVLRLDPERANARTLR